MLANAREGHSVRRVARLLNILRLTDETLHAKWLTQETIIQGAETEKMCNYASSPAAVYVLRRAQKGDDVVMCLRFVVHSEHILLATLEFLNMKVTGVVYYESRDPCIYCRGVEVPNGMSESVGLLMPVLEAFYSIMNRLNLFDIVKERHFGAAESWMAFRRSHDIDWSWCIMENKFFPYNRHTETVQEHPSIVEHATNGTVSWAWPAAPV